MNLPIFKVTNRDYCDVVSRGSDDDYSPEMEYRTLEIDYTRAQDESRTVEATLSSEVKVLRSYGSEVLLHGQENIDLSRAKDGLPLLYGHDHKDQIGIAENVRVHDGKLRAKLRFSKSARAEEIWQDVRAGIIKNVSIGYAINKYDKPGNTPETYGDRVASRWTVFEVSIVSVPADFSVGIGRSLEQGLIDPRSEEGKLIAHRANVQQVYHHLFNKYLKDKSEFTDQERAEATALAQEIGNDVSRSVQEFRDLIRNLNGKVCQVIPMHFDTPVTNSRSSAMNDKIDYRNYSLSNALLAASGDRTVDAGYEIEVSQEMSRQLGKRSNGLQVPFNALITQRAITMGGSGANLHDEQLLSSAFINVLRPKSVIMNLGVTVLPNLTGNVAVPRQTGSATASWLNMDGTDTISATDSTFDQVTLSLKSVAAMTTFSHKMLKQSTPEIESIIRNDLASVLGTAIDVAAIQGTGAANQPLGVVNQTGINTFIAASPAYADIVNMESLIAQDNADASGMAYITTPAVAMNLKTSEVSSGSGIFVWSDGSQGEGRMNGKRSFYSSNVPTGNVILGDWSQLLVGQWGGLELAADGGGTNFATGSVSVRAIMDIDFAVRHPQAFCVSTPA